ncbi:biotin--[acetyl-CoA-carboxylase] ligase [Corynebacterium kroppenstedtii]|uniref:biotin--[acetyl-CoA-carboxylase] ligase n=1 Tax=Corynebacterium sp. PCR 32 TaxID=3351342 RepID=UPI00309E60AC
MSHGDRPSKESSDSEKVRVDLPPVVEGGGATGRGPLDGDRLSMALRAQGWAHVDVVDSTGSTNADLYTAANALPHGSVLIAEEQLSGRGRLGRPWTTPRYSQVAVSVLLRPEVSPTQLGALPLVVGVAIAETVRSYGIDARVKWPNDIVVRGDKLCGILAEAVSISDNPTVVVGCGLNVDLTKEELPIANATSFALEGKRADRTDVTIAVLGALMRWLHHWHDSGGRVSSFIDDYARMSATLNEVVSVELPSGETLVGTAIDISDGGELLIRDAYGQIHTIAAGDITHLRYA